MWSSAKNLSCRSEARLPLEIVSHRLLEYGKHRVEQGFSRFTRSAWLGEGIAGLPEGVLEHP